MKEKFAHIDKEEIRQRVAALEFDRFLQYYANAVDLNKQVAGGRSQVAERGGRSEGRGQRSESRASVGNAKKLFVNLGTKDGFYKASFLQFILDMSDLKKDVLGRIDMKEMNSWIEIEASAANKMIKAIDGKKFKGRKIRMNEAN